MERHVALWKDTSLDTSERREEGVKMLNKNKLLVKLNLTLFDGDSGGEAASGSVPEEVQQVVYGKQAEQTESEAEKQEPKTKVTASTEEDRKSEFEKLIKGQYKDLYDARVRENISARFKEMESLKTKAAQVDSFAPVLEMLSSKYGVDGNDIEALTKAIQDDNSYYEEEAMEKGLTVEQLKNMKRLERENAEFKRMAEEAQRKQNADRIYSQWQQQSEEMKGVYPDFDLQNECSKDETGHRFLELLKNGIDVRTAYEVIHKDEIIGGAMQYTAQKVQQKVVNDIRARGMRPSENGAGGAATAIVKKDPSKFTNKDLAEISRRVRAGERIEF